MSVSVYFGLPGSGKTTVMTSLVFNELNKKKRKYKHIYGNVHLAIEGYTYIDNECIGKYDLSNSLILIDEATLFADSRDYKKFGQEVRDFFMLHRHYNCNICLFVQRWDALDLKIRTITDRVYYIYKPFIFGHWFTYIIPIPYGIDFVNKKTDGKKYGEIIQGYGKPDFLTKVLCKKLYRPKYYKYFDSWETVPLPALPADKYFPFKN